MECVEGVTLEVVAGTEDVLLEAVLELDLELLGSITGDRIPERMPGSEPAVAVGAFLSFGVGGVGGVGCVLAVCGSINGPNSAGPALPR